MNEILKTIKNRRSVRKYRSEQIKDEELSVILESGIYAPTGHNDQPWHFTVIQNKELINHMNVEAKKNMANAPLKEIAKIGKAGHLHIFYHAPTVIIVSGKKDSLTPLIDSSAAVQNMLLAAESLNIGSCWIALAKFFFHNPENIEKLDISLFYQTTIDNMCISENLAKLSMPEGYEPYYAVSLGYKDSSNNVAPERNRNVVNYIK